MVYLYLKLKLYQYKNIVPCFSKDVYSFTNQFVHLSNIIIYLLCHALGIWDTMTNKTDTLSSLSVRTWDQAEIFEIILQISINYNL